jgi:hypothetical protein
MYDVWALGLWVKMVKDVFIRIWEPAFEEQDHPDYVWSA